MAFMRNKNVSIVIFGYLFAVGSCANFDIPSKCAIYITLSPISVKLEDTLLDVNWGPDCHDTPPFIGFYRSDPSISYVTPETIFRTDGKSAGRINTNIKLGKLHFPNGWNRNDKVEVLSERDSNLCLPFFIASYFKTNFESVNCLRIQPNWMSQMNSLAEVHLDDVFIPGSHASGCFTSDTDTSTLKKFSVTQNFDVWTQLLFGVRYLDISVTFIDNSDSDRDNNFWIVNDGIAFNLLNTILADVRAFVERSNELVIIDFTAFGMPFKKDPKKHQRLLRLLKNELGDIIYYDPSKKLNDLTLKSVRREGKSVIVAYNEQTALEDQHLVYPSWKRYSTTHILNDDMQNYIRQIFTKKFREQLSPKKDGWVFVLSQGIDSAYSSENVLLSSRERANLMNRNVTTWLGGPWGLTANVIGLDFILSSNIIDIAIYNNRNKKADNLKGYVEFDML